MALSYIDQGFFYKDIEHVFQEPMELLENQENAGFDMRHPGYWPLLVQPAVSRPLRLNFLDQAEYIADWILEDWLNRLDYSGWHMNCSGQSIIEGWLEDYYDCCDWYDGPSEKAYQAIVRAEKIMQGAIDWWMFWNQGLIRMGLFSGRYSFLNVKRHSVGLTVIEQAVEKAEIVLRDIDQYLVPDYKNQYEIEYPL